MAFIFLVVPATCSRTYMVKTAMSLTPIPGVILLSMAIINAALERRIPIFAICRGLQELVVATGGSLHRKLCEQPELLEHREDPELPVEQQYAPSHEVQVEEGGITVCVVT